MIGPRGNEGLGDQAAAWVVRLADDGVQEEDWLAFVAWLDDAPVDRPDERRAAFDRAQAVWLDTDRLTAAAPNPRRAVASQGSRPSGGSRRGAHVYPWAAALAAACFVILAGWWVRHPRQASPRLSTALVYATAPGERRDVRLVDGSRIDLDGATTLSVDLHGPERRVALVQGEASFDVVHDPAQPFVVDLGAAQVRVLGTAFDIVRETDGTRVDVARGVVGVRQAGASVRLSAGRGAWIDRQGAIRLSTTPVGDVGAWRDGRRLYRDRPLSEVVSDLDRRYAQPILLGDPEARRMRFTGVLVLGPRETVVRRLTALLPLAASSADGGEIVLRSRRP